jgi:hypothetical protein
MLSKVKSAFGGKKWAILLLAVALLLGVVSSAIAKGFNNPPGFPLYVIIEVDWDGITPMGDWTVWGPKWDPVTGGTPLTACTNCVGVDYDFTFHGRTVQFDEVYVPGVIAYPQVRHVVLHEEKDEPGVYTGSLPAECYEFPSRVGAFHDRIDYRIEFDGDGSVVDFHYLEYEHWNQNPDASCD